MDILGVLHELKCINF